VSANLLALVQALTVASEACGEAAHAQREVFRPGAQYPPPSAVLLTSTEALERSRDAFAALAAWHAPNGSGR
jgi:hypothetical protein